jgi:serine protease
MRSARTRRMLVAALAAGLAGAAALAGIAAPVDGPLGGTPAAAHDPRSEPLAFQVDTRLRPSVRAVEPVGRLTTPRDTGVLAEPDGSTAELVLDEVVVHVKDPAELEAFLTRWGGSVLDSFAPDEQGQDHLVRVDVSRADPASLPTDLLATEPRQAGTHRASDERVLRLLALAAAEWREGREVVIDWLVEPTGIADGKVFESPDILADGQPKSVFDWSYMRAGGPMDTGVTAAWQLLQDKGKLHTAVDYLVQDGGFTVNDDFPFDRSIVKADWGDSNVNGCSGGSSCPWHGTDVVLAGMGRVGNGYGTAGPAGPVVDDLIAVRNGIDYWTVLRRLEKAAEDTHPDVVNLSFTRDVNIGTSWARYWTDRRMDHVRDTGALIVASAGNDGDPVDSDTLFIPCESVHVMCVGGMDTDATVDPDSNFGLGDSTTSVEIYGPMCVRVLADPAQPAQNATRSSCGTSFASPFVGGVAALVMAADPSLSSEQVRTILNETAHVGGLGATVTGSQRRINALAAVARALGVTVAAPSVTIDKPTAGQTFSVGSSVDLWGKAVDYRGGSLPITWTSDRDGTLADQAMTVVPPLSAGTHVITATATDSTGRTGTAKVTVTVTDAPPTSAISSPPANVKVVEGDPVNLVGTSLDPDTSTPVPDSQATWEVKRNGAVVFTADGHEATLPGAKVLPGTYTAKFTAGGVAATRSFTVTAVPAGTTKPTATITKPASKLTLGSPAGQPVPIAFAGTGTDAEDGSVSGKRYRWTAYGSNGTKKVLCQGSDVPTGSNDGKLGAVKDCGSFTGELGMLADGHVTTTWTVWLEVFDSSGLVGTDSIPVELFLVTL